MSSDIIKDWSKYEDELNMVKFILENGGVSRRRLEADAKSIIRCFYLRDSKQRLSQRLPQTVNQAR